METGTTVWKKTDNPLYNNNPYRAEYWKNYRNTVIFPSIALATSIEFFDAFYLMGVKKNYNLCNIHKPSAGGE